MRDDDEEYKKPSKTSAEIVKSLYYATFYTLFLIAWVAILWTTIIYKFVDDGNKFFNYFTNWNWFFQTIFFSLELFSYAFGLQKLRIFTLSFFFWLVNGTTWLVFWLVLFMIKDNAVYFLQLSNLDGGQYSFALVLEGHMLFHVLISVSILIYIVLQKDHIDDSVSPYVGWDVEHHASDDEGDFYPEYGEDQKGHMHYLFHKWNYWSGLFLFYTFAMPLLLIGIYVSVFDIRSTYGIITPFWQLALSALAIILVFNVAYPAGAMIYIIEPKTRLYRYYSKSLYLMCE